MEGTKEKRETGETNAGRGDSVQLPTESSPYVKYKDVEDYKLKGYGTQGHKPPVDMPHQGVGTDAPTLSGGGISEGPVKDADSIIREAVP